MKKKILLVEESKAISFLVQTLLEKKYDTCLAQDSYYAIKEMVSQKHFDCIIISMDSKDSDSFHLLQHVTSSSVYKHIPVMVLANRHEAGLEAECTRLGIAGYVEKPFDPQVFSKKIDDLLLAGPIAKPIKRPVKIFNLNFYI